MDPIPGHVWYKDIYHNTVILDPYWRILRVLYTNKLNCLIRSRLKVKFISPFSSSAYIYNIYSVNCYKRHKFIYSKYSSNVTNDVIFSSFGINGQVIEIVTKKSQ